MSTVQVIQGFSLTNRWLLYTSLMLAPAQYLSGLKSRGPGNIGFLAYNYYTQITWYRAIKGKQLHALSLLPFYFNMIYMFTYLGGISSTNRTMRHLCGLGTVGVVVLNTVAAWTSWATNLPDGYGEYQFFLFGWRTLSPSLRKFFLMWQICDSILVLGFIKVVNKAVAAKQPVPAKKAVPAMELTSTSERTPDQTRDHEQKLQRLSILQWLSERPWWDKYIVIPGGAVVVLLVTWPLILWTELIIARNHIQSETDMVAVWVFVIQFGALLLPSYSGMVASYRAKFTNQSTGSSGVGNTTGIASGLSEDH